MNRKVLAGIFSAVLVMAVGTPAAMADHAGTSKPSTSGHFDPPEEPQTGVVQAVCVVDGGVVVDDENGQGGVGPGAVHANHNHYEFVDAALECDDVNPDSPNLTGVYAVTATGATDGLQEFCAAGHGECSEWGYGDDGVLEAKGPHTVNGEVDFVREAVHVTAYGELNSATAGNGCFIAELAFEPTDSDPTDPTKKLKAANLDGVATIMQDCS